MNWSDMIEQRDSEGKLTDLALALNALAETGCDCGTDEDVSCVGCLCERALKGLWEQLDAANTEVARLNSILSANRLLTRVVLGSMFVQNNPMDLIAKTIEENCKKHEDGDD